MGGNPVNARLQRQEHAHVDDAIVGLAPRRTQGPTQERAGGRAAGATEELTGADRGGVPGGDQLESGGSSTA